YVTNDFSRVFGTSPKNPKDGFHTARQCPLKAQMRLIPVTLLYFILLAVPGGAQNNVPTFRISAGRGSYTLAGRDPAQSGTTTVQTLLAPIQLSFEGNNVGGGRRVMDAAPDFPSILRSPVFSNFAYPGEQPTQYADALLRATLPGHADWHTF